MILFSILCIHYIIWFCTIQFLYFTAVTFCNIIKSESGQVVSSHTAASDASQHIVYFPTVVYTVHSLQVGRQKGFVCIDNCLLLCSLSEMKWTTKSFFLDLKTISSWISYPTFWYNVKSEWIIAIRKLVKMCNSELKTQLYCHSLPIPFLKLVDAFPKE